MHSQTHSSTSFANFAAASGALPQARDLGLVSIVMPTHNCARYIAESVESVLAQTYSNWELLIVDDASSDGTASLVSALAQRAPEKIHPVFLDVQRGAANARNTALARARGRWIAFLDGDDVWAPSKLAAQLSFMVDGNYQFSCTDYAVIDPQSQHTGTVVTAPNRITYAGFLRYDWIGCLTAVYDANAVGLIQVPHLAKRNDYAMWLKVSRSATCYRLPETLAFYRKGDASSLSSGGFARLIKHHYRLFRISEGYSPLRAGTATLRNLVFGFYKKQRYHKRTS